jgi:hypothetical protein
MSESEVPPPARRRLFALRPREWRWIPRRLSATGLGIVTSVLALLISIWSTTIAQQAKNLQEEGVQRAQADQVVILQYGQPGRIDQKSATWSIEDTFVQNFSRLPLPSIHFMMEWRNDQAPSKVFTYDLGALPSCHQYHIAELYSDGLQRRPGEGYFFYLHIWFIDAAGQQWLRGPFDPAEPYEHGGLVTGSERMPILPPPSEAIPDCVPG